MGEPHTSFSDTISPADPEQSAKGLEMTIIWNATITKEMVTHLSAEQISFLIDSLNDAVAQICDEDGVKN